MTAPKEDEISSNIKSYHGIPLLRSEYNALMEFEQQITNPLPLVSEWNSNIFGFIARENHVIALGIPSKDLTILTENICNLKYLTRLSLKNNLLSSLPDKIGNLTALIHLDLFRNNLNSLPEGFGNLINLQTLELGENQLTSIPLSIGNLNSLVTLTLTNNFLSSLPVSFGNLSALREVNNYFFYFADFLLSF